MQQKYIFIAGGIGITPFRSMIQDLLDKRQPINATLFYQVRDKKDLLFMDIFAKAEKELGLVVVPLINKDFTIDLLSKSTPDFVTRRYYISGPQGMVEAYRMMLEDTGIPFENIKTDLFTGYD